MDKSPIIPSSTGASYPALPLQPVQQESSSAPSFDLLSIWHAVWYRKGSILTLMLVVMMLAALVVMAITPTYRASATLLIEDETPNVLSIDQMYGASNGGSEYLQTQFELLRSRELAERVVKQLNLVRHPEFDPRQTNSPLSSVRQWFADLQLGDMLPFTMPGDLETSESGPSEAEILDQAVKSFRDRITIKPVPKTQLVKVQVEMADAETAAWAANKLAEAYIDSQREAKILMTEATTEWMNQRMASLKQDLVASEQALQAYRDQENLIDLQGVKTVPGGELTDTRSKLVDARRAKAEAESQYNQVAALDSGSWQALASAPAVMSDTLVQQFSSKRAEALARVNDLAQRYGPKHPKMQSAQTELAAASAALRAQVQQVVASIKRQYQLAVANEAALQTEFERNRDQIQTISRKEFKLSELQREVNTNRSLYDTFLTRLKESVATADLDAGNARVVDKAVVPDIPVSPLKKQVVLGAGILALLLGAALSVLLDKLNNTFKSAEEIEEKLNLPVLGLLPLLKNRERANIAQMFSTNSDTDRTFLESVRTIRTGVVLSGLDNPLKVMLVTSSVPGEGKSSVAANLAFSMGQMEKVLLIDADMRRPTAAKSFDLPVGTPGLANLISGTAKPDDCIRRVGDIDLISAGTVPPNPLELLSSKRFTSAIKYLSDKYDRIVIDSPPTQAVSDAFVLSAVSDGVIYVVKYESTAVPMVERGVGRLLQNRAPLTGVVLNQVNVDKARKQGNSAGDYYDYYGYSGGSQGGRSPIEGVVG